MSPDPTRFMTRFDWVPVVTRGDRKPYCFGTKQTRLSECPDEAVYRWIFHPLGTPPTCLVGSTDDLYRRVSEYHSHTSEYHASVRQAFEEHRSSGGTVRLEVLQFDAFYINGAEFSNKRLIDPFICVALEKICCAELESQGVHLLNSNLMKKTLRMLQSLLGKSTPAEAAEVLSELRGKTNG